LKPHFIAAIDQGTTSTRCLIFDGAGSVVSLAQKEHRQIFPRPGWVEHDPMEIWANTQEVVSLALQKAGISAGDLLATGIANQRETTVIWEKATGRPVANAIVWQDTRTDEICRSLSEVRGQDRFRPKTGLPLATYFAGPKISWLLDNVPGLRGRALAGEVLFGTIDTWLIWNLTGGLHVTDVTNASRTMLMDLHTLQWDREMLAALGIPEIILPEIVSSSMVYGQARGVLEGVRIAGDLGDQQAALFGQTCFESGEAKNTYGTGCFLLLNTGTKPVPSTKGLLTTLAYRIGDGAAVYALEGSVAIAGAAVQWLRDNLGIISRSGDVESLARTVPDNGDVYFVPAFSGLFAPYWRSDARGIIAGLTRYANKGHIARAALEATAYQTREILDAMASDSGVALASLRVDGGMVHNELLMQFQSDITGAPVVRPATTETTALGAAFAAGLAVGFWSGFAELSEKWRSDREWRPEMSIEHREALFRQWLKAVDRTLNWTPQYGF
jgi:glycerol kinase